MKPSVVPGPALVAASFALVTFCSAIPAFAQDTGAGRALAAACFTCHGTDGNSVGGVPPSLAGRPSAELFQMMKDFQAGKRPATIMHQQAKGYSDAQLQSITAYFAAVKPGAARPAAKP
ncbi:MAG TPA: cytochrome c [Burkholderiales bacterium]|nr:cytochrome c [Burkholderiales bacterium]